MFVRGELSVTTSAHARKKQQHTNNTTHLVELGAGLDKHRLAALLDVGQVQQRRRVALCVFVFVVFWGGGGVQCACLYVV